MNIREHNARIAAAKAEVDTLVSILEKIYPHIFLNEQCYMWYHLECFYLNYKSTVILRITPFVILRHTSTPWDGPPRLCDNSKDMIKGNKYMTKGFSNPPKVLTPFYMLHSVIRYAILLVEGSIHTVKQILSDPCKNGSAFIHKLNKFNNN